MITELPVNAGAAVSDRLARAVAGIDLVERRRASARLTAAEGAAQLFHVDANSTSAPFAIEPVPYCIDHEDWRVLEAGLAQRLRLTSAIVSDVYGQQRLLREGVLPAERLFASPNFVRSCRSIPAPLPIASKSFTVEFGADHPQRFRILRSNFGAVNGLGAALMVRSITARVLPEAVDALAPTGLDTWLRRYRTAIAALAPAGHHSPRVVVLADSRAEDYAEHAYLAMRLGYHAVEADDLAVRAGRLWMRSLGQLEPVDVVIRAVHSLLADSLEMPHHGTGVPALAMALRSGSCAIVNALGSEIAADLADDALLRAACELLLHEPLLLGHDAAGFPPHAVRLHAVAALSGEGALTLPGGFTRVDEDRTIRDLWIVGGDRSGSLRGRVAPLPQIDLRGSVPARVAESLFWLGRGAERTELVARTLHSIATYDDFERVHELPWAHRLVAELARLSQGPEAGGERADAPLHHIWPVALEACLTSTLASARTSRAFLSTAAWRVVGRLELARQAFVDLSASWHRVGFTETVDDLLLDLLAIAGASMESVVRGPAWLFLDLGRRVERALSTLAIAAAVESDLTDEPDGASAVILASCESLIAYRRRYRSDFRRDAIVDLVLCDTANPRAVAFQVARIREHQAGWPLPPSETDDDLLDEAAEALTWAREDVMAMLLPARAALLAYAERVSARWFSHLDVAEEFGGRA